MYDTSVHIATDGTRHMARTRTRDSYAAVGRASFGELGERAVVLVQASAPTRDVFFLLPRFRCLF